MLSPPGNPLDLFFHGRISGPMPHTTPRLYRHRFALVLLGVLLLGTTAPSAVVAQTADASAQTEEPTRVVVRAVSNDAKLLQDPVGGARIRIENAETGEVLAEGLQRGDSGSTQKIMRTPHERGMTRYDTEGAAKFDTTL